MTICTVLGAYKQNGYNYYFHYWEYYNNFIVSLTKKRSQ